MNYERIGTGTLVAATIVVGGAIAIGDEPGRILNGVGGLTWFASSGLLVLAARKSNTTIGGNGSRLSPSRRPWRSLSSRRT